MRVVVLLAVLAACYEVPHPSCGFQCGPPLVANGPGACPDGYACVADRCRLDTEPPVSCPAIEEPPEADAPGVMARQPADGESDVDLQPDILVTFDENVTDVSTSTFRLSVGDQLVEGTVGPLGEGARVFIFRPPLLEKNATYTVTLTSGIRDLDGYPLPETSWVFSTITDHEGPQLVVTTPSNGAVDVSTATRIACAFSETIDPPSATSIRLERDGVAVPSTLTGIGNTVEIDYGASLVGSSTYTVLITDEIRDEWGNAATPATFSFTTRDVTPPTITAREPIPDATGVPVMTAIAVTFSEEVDVDDTTFTLSDASGAIATTFAYAPLTNTASLTPIAALAPDTVYTVSLGVIRDLTGNPLSAPAYTFTTAPE